jgi:hypothetical protein
MMFIDFGNSSCPSGWGIIYISNRAADSLSK